MAKVVIDNRSDDSLTGLIEKKLSLTLASAMTSLSKLVVKLDEVTLDHSSRRGFRCEVQATFPNAKLVQLHTENPEAHSAIEGAISRMRREVVRSRKPFLRAGGGSGLSDASITESTDIADAVDSAFQSADRS